MCREGYRRVIDRIGRVDEPGEGDTGSGRVARQKTKRPRDELGRPLPWSSENRLALEDFDSLPLEENHRLGVEHFNGGRFFPAHEAWETAWKQAKGSPDEEFFKGLSQLGAGYVHYRRGNPHGTFTLLRRGVRRITRYGPRHRGVDVGSLAATAGDHADVVEAAHRAGASLPEIESPRV
jgi:predicted metal-dependent hydrolase